MAEESENLDSTMSESVHEDFPGTSGGEKLEDEKKTIVLKDILDLLGHFMDITHSATVDSSQGLTAQTKCEELLSKDYCYSVITNDNGELCPTYPYNLIFLESELEKYTDEEIDASYYRTSSVPKELKNLMFAARLSRCRQRFVVPTILYEGKNICRSATLSNSKEVLYHHYMVPGSAVAEKPSTTEQDKESESFYSAVINKCYSELETATKLIGTIRKHDIELLKWLSVKNIIDLMVENKKVKYNMNFSSSEKIDKENRYFEFNISSLPYPGCEFFEEFTNSKLNANINFDWEKPEIDAELSVPDTEIVSDLGINWKKYKEWDLLTITQNYMKLILAYIKKDKDGILIHCISGWDRTPLFISLLRLSLWADGKIHKSLSPVEMLYLTLAYDWYLFSHNLANRVAKQELVLLFCFEFLKYFHHAEFSVLDRKEIPKEVLREENGAAIEVEKPKPSDRNVTSRSSGRFEILSSAGSSQDASSGDCSECWISLMRKAKLGAVLEAFNPAWGLAYCKMRFSAPEPALTSYPTALVEGIQSMLSKYIDYGMSFWQ